MFQLNVSGFSILNEETPACRFKQLIDLECVLWLPS